jgi:hypothetical protein
VLKPREANISTAQPRLEKILTHQDKRRTLNCSNRKKRNPQLLKPREITCSTAQADGQEDLPTAKGERRKSLNRSSREDKSSQLQLLTPTKKKQAGREARWVPPPP